MTSTLEALEARLEAATNPNEIAGTAAQLAIMKAHILACSTPKLVIPAQIIAAIASGTAYGAYNVIAEFVDALPHKNSREDAMRQCIQLFLMTTAEELDTLNAALSTPEGVTKQ